MNDLPKPRVTEWDFGAYKVVRWQDQCTFTVWKNDNARSPTKLRDFETYEGAVLSFAKEIL